MKKILGVFVFAAILAVPAMASVAIQVPDGFMAVSDSPMTWANAKAWCEQRGGRLPLINGAAFQTWEQIVNPKTVLIDGFGQISTGRDVPADWTTPWPPGLPSGDYWTGAEHSDYLGVTWFVCKNGGSVVVFGDVHQSDSIRAVCVP